MSRDYARRWTIQGDATPSEGKRHDWAGVDTLERPGGVLRLLSVHRLPDHLPEGPYPAGDSRHLHPLAVAHRCDPPRQAGVDVRGQGAGEVRLGCPPKRHPDVDRPL